MTLNAEGSTDPDPDTVLGESVFRDPGFYAAQLAFLEVNNANMALNFTHFPCLGRGNCNYNECAECVQSSDCRSGQVGTEASEANSKC